MSEVALASASVKQKWIAKYFQEYVRDSRFMPYMSNADLNKGGIILTRYELQQEAGKTINIPFIGRLTGSGVTGSEILDGAEEELTNYNFPISIDWRRNAVRVPKSESYKTEINLLNAARDMLQVWESEKFRDDIIKALAAVVTDTSGTTVNFDAASAGNKNTWTAANADRILFGNAISNYSATFSTGAGNVTSAMKASTSILGLAKRMAKIANPRIRPWRVDSMNGREFYVAFHGARSFRDLKADTTMQTANTSARAREDDGWKNNPIFQDGDLFYDGVLHREVPEIDDYCASAGFNGIGNSSADVRPVFLCGSGAVGVAWGQEPTPRTDYVKDYGFRPGVAIEELLGVKKINYNGVQNGIVTVLVGAAADS
jgi:N4-gp56 family major capsid protein